MPNKYPIYRITVRWSEKQPEIPHKLRESSPGRFWNSVCWDAMERKVINVDTRIVQLWREWWPTYSAKFLEPAQLSITVESRDSDTWCSGWFSHWTFDTGQSDLEVLGSFAEYVDRIQRSDRTDKSSLLMGAEDEWRWCAGDRTPAPCRCLLCKQQGIVRIDH